METCSLQGLGFESPCTSAEMCIVAIVVVAVVAEVEVIVAERPSSN